uniref:Uncharacterized protein n=1 Tax=Globisporangium ultimum (strain ATCC 200006 / CBS 805.95 / DAOM BR144) TaxID=431595 RepID=K3WV00_GLOUD
MVLVKPLEKPLEMTLPQLSLSATAVVAALAIGFWVVSFPRCIIMHPVGECSWLGLTVNCLPAIDLESPWNYLLAHWLLAGVLFTIGCVNALAINFKGNYLMTASTTGYVWITAAFAIFRAQYGIGKPLLIGAAMHNWFEWHAHMVNTTTRTLHFANDRELTETLEALYNEDMVLKYTLPGYKGVVALYNNVTSGGCDATYAFRTDGKTHKVNDVYRDFMNNRVPALQAMFSS